MKNTPTKLNNDSGEGGKHASSQGVRHTYTSTTATIAKILNPFTEAKKKFTDARTVGLAADCKRGAGGQAREDGVPEVTDDVVVRLVLGPGFLVPTKWGEGTSSFSYFAVLFRTRRGE